MDTDPDRRRKENHGLWLAPGLTVLALAASGVDAGAQPFGPRSRSSNDLAMQYVPMHAHLWDLLHGVGPGDIFFNWQSGFGVPFPADFAYYLSSPFAVLVGVFPRDQTALAVYVITVLKLAAAATAMAALDLHRCRP